ncbi:MAG: DUF192 domain-containing protein [Gammaproteobacteria bacterium]|nr:DUF192 domain-containing protein [Gammaproteobacteria bacterium]
MLRLARLLCIAFLLLAASARAETATISLATELGTHLLTAEIADTSETRARGLMHREDFGGDDAMLFVFPKAGQLYFWMKNTPVSLDIIFFDDKGIWLNTHSHTKPFSIKSLPSRGFSQYVLELPAGRASRLGIGQGSVVKRLE